MGRFTAAFVLSVGLALVVAGQTRATTPVIGSFAIDETFVDDGASAACGFPVTATNTGTGHFQRFFNDAGIPIRFNVEENVTGTLTANGLTVYTAGNFLGRFDLVDGTVTNAGINIRVSVPGGGTLYIDRGRLVFDANGDLVTESGPHPSLHGDFPGLCAALTP
jgi:hypothetical protein